MNYEISSYSSAGPVRLGMTVDQVRRVLGDEFNSFKKSPGSEFLTDSFRSDSVHVYYDADGVCEAVEFFRPANLLLEGETLINRPFRAVLEWLRERDPDLTTDDSGLTSPKYGIGLYAPAARKEPSEPVESVIVFRRGYYSM